MVSMVPGTLAHQLKVSRELLVGQEAGTGSPMAQLMAAKRKEKTVVPLEATKQRKSQLGNGGNVGELAKRFNKGGESDSAETSPTEDAPGWSVELWMQSPAIRLAVAAALAPATRDNAVEHITSMTRRDWLAHVKDTCANQVADVLYEAAQDLLASGKDTAEMMNDKFSESKVRLQLIRTTLADSYSGKCG